MTSGSGSVPALRWRLIVDAEPREGPLNMALDHALAGAVPPGEGVLRLYRWEAPTVSFGRNEPARDHYDAEEGRSRGIAFVRRPTGGRAVLHDEEITYAAVAPLKAFGGPRAAYRAINEGLVAGLRTLGVAAAVTDEGEVLGPDAGPCFGAPAPGEVVGGGRKLVGSAQVRMGRAFLQHGSVILDGDQTLLAELAGREAEASDHPATVRSLAPSAPDEEAVRAALAEGCRLAWGGAWEEGDYLARELESAERLRAERYATEAWTWRR